MWWDNAFSTFQVLIISVVAFLVGLTLGYLLRIGWRKPVVPPQAKEESQPAPSTCIHCGNHVTWEPWQSSQSDDRPVVWLCPYCGLAKGKWS